MNDRLKGLADAGVSIWLDDLSRTRLQSGNLQGLIDDMSVTGVTTNPTIFAAALTNGADYAAQLAGLSDVDEAITACTTTDVRDACDLFADTYEATAGFDGRVSIEVAPTLANDTDKPELNQAHHRHLVHWALYRAFSKPDADGADPTKAARAEANFTKYFGIAPDADLRRSTRSDEAQTNKAFWA